MNQLINYKIILPIQSSNPAITHARLRAYTFSIEVSYGTIAPDGKFKTHTWEVIPYRGHPRLKGLRQKGNWVTDKVLETLPTFDCYKRLMREQQQK